MKTKKQNMSKKQVEVQYGKWLFDEYGWVCSICDFPISIRYGKKSVCPSCKAKMEGE